MPRLPRDVSGSEIVQILERFGFTFVRKKGSHIVMKKHLLQGGSIACVVPDHSNLAVGTLQGILKQAGISREEFLGMR